MAEARYSKDKLKAMSEMKIEVIDPRYKAVEIVGGGEFLYDPQVFWAWDEKSPWARPPGSILVSEIGGQQTSEWDPTMGHGAIYRLHADNQLETIMAPGVGRQCGVFRPIIAPQGWGEWGNHIFFCSQIVPGRRGAVFEHIVYRLAPGATTPEAFAIPPRAGKLGGGLAGALMPGVFGRPGTPEEGLFLIISLHNCTIYAAKPDGSIEPYIIMDGENGPGPLMPYRLYYADEKLSGEPNALAIEGPWGESFGAGGHEFNPQQYRVIGRDIDPQPVGALGNGPGPFAPEAFGPFAGDMFRVDNAGFISSVHWARGDREALPYTDKIMRRDANGEEHVFAANVQAGQNLIGFAGNRMIITNLRHSYSSGDFHEPDGSIYAIEYKGE
jgi:hypothetical protein